MNWFDRNWYKVTGSIAIFMIVLSVIKNDYFGIAWGALNIALALKWWGEPLSSTEENNKVIEVHIPFWIPLTFMALVVWLFLLFIVTEVIK